MNKTWELTEGLDVKNLDLDPTKALKKLFAIGKDIVESYGIEWKNNFIKGDNNPKNVDFALTMALPIAYKTKRDVGEVVREILETTVKEIKLSICHSQS